MVWIFSPPAAKQIHQKKLSEKILYETIADALGADCFSEEEKKVLNEVHG
jgi:hypothetical protein